MVRLLVPAGEGQHSMCTRKPEPHSASMTIPSIIHMAPTCAGITRVTRKILRWPLPNSWYSTGITTVILAPVVVYSFTALHSVKKSAYKKEGIQMIPGQLWERSQSWTMDDGIVAGGALGLIASFRYGRIRYALDALTPLKRSLGHLSVAVCGAAVGSVCMGLGTRVHDPYWDPYKAAMRRLSHDPGFMESLTLRERTYVGSWAKEAGEEVSTPLHHTDRSSRATWLTPAVFQTLYDSKPPSNPPLLWNSDPSSPETPIDRKQVMLREADMEQSHGEERETASAQCAVLMLLKHILNDLARQEAQTNPRFDMAVPLASLTPRAPSKLGHSPRVSAEWIHNVREHLVGYGQQNPQGGERVNFILNGVETLKREFEGQI
ncbi:hypothetical protein K458DRAFT_485980 [Lentithecium fluviatile CBS 122367]|uniref:Uncharacterized protein n=1 Tax=Lentithecium fluviatile CBS 122367 TaxID=1168545 RepID=A0A6G1J9J8_9PLEO|nr:hypothetical protein K458DRAFT_485980 [Lentithecium fluviatile CBS 122367]